MSDIDICGLCFRVYQDDKELYYLHLQWFHNLKNRELNKIKMGDFFHD